MIEFLTIEQLNKTPMWYRKCSPDLFGWLRSVRFCKWSLLFGRFRQPLVADTITIARNFVGLETLSVKSYTPVCFTSWECYRYAWAISDSIWLKWSIMLHKGSKYHCKGWKDEMVIRLVFTNQYHLQRTFVKHTSGRTIFPSLTSAFSRVQKGNKPVFHVIPTA